jgi:hypothetical protein
VAPRTSLWVGVRTGWFWPFGSLYAQGVPVGGDYWERHSVDIRTYATSGPLLELDAGVRLARNYGLFGFWQRVWLGAGNGDSAIGGHGAQQGGDSDFWGAGVRATSDADAVGFVSEFALGYRRARVEFEDGSAIEATHSFPEVRFSLGADIRISRLLSVAPMASFGIGGFSEVKWVDSRRNSIDLIGPYGARDSHGWFELQLGGHFDLFGVD